jgi:branched-chain amino acid transport system permease protein
MRIARWTPESRVGVVGALVGLGVLATLPRWGTSSNMATVAEIMALLALAQMWNLLAGFAGLVSIGQQAFIGIGAYALLVIADDRGVDPFVAVWLAALVAAVLSVPIGVLAFRLRGGYFAIGTWVIAQVVFLMVTNNTALGGGNGRSLLSLGDYDRLTREDYTFYTSLVVGAGAVLVVVLILRSRLGLALRAIRDDEAGARAAGVDVYRAKLVVWVIAAAWTGLAGGVIYLARLNVQPTSAFSVQWTAFMIFIVVIGGLGSTTGPIIGTLVFWVLRDQLADLGEWYLIILGSIAVLMAILAPKGIYGLLNRVRPFQLFPVQRRLRPARGRGATGGSAPGADGGAVPAEAPTPLSGTATGGGA